MQAAIEKAKKKVGELGELSGDLEQAIDELGYEIEERMEGVGRMEDAAAVAKSALKKLERGYKAASAKEERRSKR